MSAVAQGRRHIRLMDHVDLRRQPTQWPGSQQILGFVPWTTWSITVRTSYVGLKILNYQRHSNPYLAATIKVTRVLGTRPSLDWLGESRRLWCILSLSCPV